ncbi:VanZ family protein [uncultured Muribaculum sp.]|uniref:VanZ family protein n=1 Tax=uncultured Muribaculum sp. TaxID=1918613 RepID=UPI0025CC084F|nr:VanZ family protein [uncultured Muribaculum sp.]
MFRLLIRGLPAWTLSIVCFLAIAYLTLWPDPLQGRRIELFEGADKVVHAIMMMGMMLCMGLDALRKKAAHRFDDSVRAPKGLLTVYMLIVVLFGGAIELLQGAMGLGRGEDWADFGADAVGAAVGWVICLLAWSATVRWMFPEQE